MFIIKRNLMHLILQIDVHSLKIQCIFKLQIPRSFDWLFDIITEVRYGPNFIY